MFAVHEQRTLILNKPPLLNRKSAMLKPQDCIILIKLLANPGVEWSQRQLAQSLCISLAETNAGIKRLGDAGLLRKNKDGRLFPNINVQPKNS